MASAVADEISLARCTPKAEVTSSNLVGRASFQRLSEWYYVRVPTAEALRKQETRRNRTHCRMPGAVTYRIAQRSRAREWIMTTTDSNQGTRNQLCVTALHDALMRNPRPRLVSSTRSTAAFFRTRSVFLKARMMSRALSSLVAQGTLIFLKICRVRLCLLRLVVIVSGAVDRRLDCGGCRK
jgi:hypothetical protein